MKEEKTDTFKKFIFLCLLIIIFLWLSYYSVVNYLFGAERGTYGDMYGALNTLFSGFAFLGIIYAILIQKQELELQRQELASTRQELKGQKEQMEGQKKQLEAQNKNLKTQRHENTFFHLLSQQNEIVSNLYMEIGGHQRRAVFQSLYREMNKIYSHKREHDKSATEKQILEAVYSVVYEPSRHNFDHYFKNLYAIILFVDETFQNKTFYINLIKAQLSVYEVIVLFYYSISTPHHEEMKLLLEKYSFLQDIVTSKLFKKEHMQFYTSQAFGMVN